MRILVCMCLLAGGVAAQDTAKISPPPPAKPVKKTPAVMAIPKDAVETEPGFYRWTDKSGKVWTYRRTPFGVRRMPAEAMDLQQADRDKRNAAESRMSAVELGDSIRFAEDTPFGKRTWVRKKTELNDTEQRVWDSQQKNGAASRTAEKE